MDTVISDSNSTSPLKYLYVYVFQNFDRMGYGLLQLMSYMDVHCIACTVCRILFVEEWLRVQISLRA
jgi:hypothetical protein